MNRRTFSALLLLFTAASATVSAQTLIERGPEASASLFPDRIILTWNGDPARTQAVTWRTAPSVSNPVAELANADAPVKLVHYENRTREAVIERSFARRIPARSQDHPESGARYHSVVFDGLTPGSQYFYRVGDGEHWSEWF